MEQTYKFKVGHANSLSHPRTIPSTTAECGESGNVLEQSVSGYPQAEQGVLLGGICLLHLQILWVSLPDCATMTSLFASALN